MFDNPYLGPVGDVICLWLIAAGFVIVYWIVSQRDP